MPKPYPDGGPKKFNLKWKIKDLYEHTRETRAWETGESERQRKILKLKH